MHERTLDADFLLIITKHVLLHRHKTDPSLPPIKIILMSATLDQGALQTYFGGAEVNTLTLSLSSSSPIRLMWCEIPVNMCVKTSPCFVYPRELFYHPAIL